MQQKDHSGPGNLENFSRYEPREPQGFSVTRFLCLFYEIFNSRILNVVYFKCISLCSNQKALYKGTRKPSICKVNTSLIYNFFSCMIISKLLIFYSNQFFKELNLFKSQSLPLPVNFKFHLSAMYSTLKFMKFSIIQLITPIQCCR